MLLNDANNYQTKYTIIPTEAFTKYIGLLTEYLVNSVEKISIRNNIYFNYVLVKGIETINHIFRLILLYTRNLELTYHHCQKAFPYYIEFIGQMGEDHHSFLKLNSKDAILFVYKKTIFEIDTEHKKKFTCSESNNDLLDCIFLLTNIYSSAIKQLISVYDYKDDVNKRNNILTYIYDNILGFNQSLMDLSIGLTTNAYSSKLNTINKFWYIIIELTPKAVLVTEAFIKKIQKKDIDDIEKMLCILKRQDSTDKLTTLKFSAARYVTWLYNEL
jgi:hypothetical protein